MACSRKIEVNGKVMCTSFQLSSDASVQLTRDSNAIECGQELSTGMNYGFDLKGIISSDMQFRIEATSKDLTPFPGAAFSEPLVYNGKILMIESNRNSFPEFSKYKSFSLWKLKRNAFRGLLADPQISDPSIASVPKSA
jgi:hypothetical protein